MPGREMNRRATAALVVGLVALVGVRSALAAPARLQLTVEKSTLRVGEKTRLTVAFFDRANHVVPNDRERVISLSEQDVGTGPKGSGVLSAGQITIPAGSASCADMGFTARKPGRLMIRATSSGLAPGEDLVTIVEQTGFVLPDFLFQTVHAQVKGSLQILPRDRDPIPVNEVSGAPLWVTLDRPLTRGEKLNVRVTTVPAVPIFYKGETTVGWVDLVIDEADGRSNEVRIQSPRKRTIRVVAEVPGADLRDEVSVEFVLAHPAGILFDPDHRTIPSRQRKLPLGIQLADQDGVPITTLDQVHGIEIASVTEDIVTVEPEPVFELSPTRPAHQVVLTLRAFPAGGDLRLMASDREGDLKSGMATVVLQSQIRRVKVEGPATVHGGGRDYPVTLRLVDEAGTPQTADWDRRIFVTADNGSVEPTPVKFSQGEDHATARFFAANARGTVTIQAESAGLEPGSWKTNVITAVSLLLFLAGLGGALGGLARHVYRVRTPILWPSRRDGQLEPGLLGNAAFSVVFGLVHFQAAELGFHSFQPAGAYDNGTSAFFLGVLGGFAGVLVLERLLNVVLPPRGEIDEAGLSPGVMR